MKTFNLNIMLLVCALLGGVLVLFATGVHGIALSNDSATYIGTARSVMRGSGMNSFDGSPLVIFPPMYPLLLGIVSWLLQQDPLRLATVMNAVLFGGVVYFGGFVAYRVLKIRALALAATLAIAVAQPLVLVSSYAWSETLFIFFTMAALVLAYDYLEWQRTKTLLLLAIVLACACPTRYSGTALLSWGLLLTLILNRATRARKLRDTLLLVGIVALPLALWAVRNLLESGTPFGPRGSTMFTLQQNLGFVFESLSGLYFPQFLSLRRVLVLAVGIGILVGICWRANSLPFRRFLVVQAPILALVLLYLIFLVVSATTIALDQINGRLLSPVDVPLILLTFGVIEAIAVAASTVVASRIVYSAVALVVVGWLVFVTATTLAFAIDLRTIGQGYTDERWRTSPTLAFLRAQPLPKDCELDSNNPAGLYLLTGYVASYSPLTRGYNSPNVYTAELEQLRGKWPSADKTCLIWFENELQGRFFDPKNLQTITPMLTFAKFDDGAVYLVTRK